MLKSSTSPSLSRPQATHQYTPPGFPSTASPTAFELPPKLGFSICSGPRLCKLFRLPAPRVRCLLEGALPALVFRLMQGAHVGNQALGSVRRRPGAPPLHLRRVPHPKLLRDARQPHAVGAQVR